MAATPSRRASLTALPEELVEEILLRLPPDDPGCLLHVSLVCNTWGLAVSHPGFRRRFHEHHRTPPVLGFLHDWVDERVSHFIPTTASSFSPAAPDSRSWRAIDCRHGRALFLSKGSHHDWEWELLLWEPTTGAQWRVPVPAAFETDYPTAAVLCAAAADGCDHRDCLGAPFRLVLVFAPNFDDDTDEEEYVTSVCVYSSETGTWGEPTSLHGQIAIFTEYSSVLVGNSLLYFLSDGEAIQEYDLARHSLTVFDAPDLSFEQKFNLMLAENGELLVSESLNRCLRLWSRELSGGTRAGWVLSRVIYLENLLPNDALEDAVHVLGFAEGANAIFVSTGAGLFMIKLQSEQVRKVCDVRTCCNLIPVVGFYTPHSRPNALRGEHHDQPLPQNSTKEETLKFARELLDKGCKAMQGRNFANASVCFSFALKIRVLHYGELDPQCASTFYRYGCALLCKALASAPDEESAKITATTSKDDAGSSSASGSNVEHVPPSERGDSEEEGNLNHKDNEDCNANMTSNEDGSDLHLAWKMLDIARAIVVKSPEKTMEKANIFYALAEVSMKRGDTDCAIDYYLESLAILEHLFSPDSLRVAQLNFRICVAFELASKVWDAIPYCAKAISACNSRIRDLKNGKEGLLADKDVSASAAAGGHSGKFAQEEKISSLTRILARLQKKLKELEQAISKPSSGIDKIMKRGLSHKQVMSGILAIQQQQHVAPEVELAEASNELMTS